MAKDQAHFGKAYSLETPQQTRDHYRAWAETYDQEIGAENEYAQPARVADALVRHGAVSDAAVLDAGCGSGLSGVALLQAGFVHIDGCDFSPEMLAKAAEKNVYRSLLEADLNSPLTAFESEAYACVVAVGVFSFGHVSPDACEELLRVLAPDGLLVIAVNEQFWNKGTLEAKLDDLASQAKIDIAEKQFGEHLPGHDVKGWVIVARKR